MRVIETDERSFGPGAVFVVEEVHEEFSDFGDFKDSEFLGVLDVHYLIADVVGGFGNINERMSQEFSGLNFGDFELRSDSAIYFLFGLEEAEFSFLVCMNRREGVFHDRSDRRISHCHSALASAFEFVGKESERVCISFEVNEVAPLLGVESVFERCSGPFAEESGDCFFSGVTERGISEVVAKASSSDDVANGFEFVDPRFVRVFFRESERDFMPH